jgi:hypothetical protein
MRLADGTVANIETVVHQQDERIVQGKVIGREHFRGQMTLTYETGSRRSSGADSNNTTL